MMDFVTRVNPRDVYNIDNKASVFCLSFASHLSYPRSTFVTMGAFDVVPVGAIPVLQDFMNVEYDIFR